MTSTYAREFQKGSTSYRWNAQTDETGNIILDLIGNDTHGVIVADGRFKIPAADGAEIGKALAKTVAALSRLVDQKPKASNANTPWSKELDELLRARWLKLAPTTDANKKIRELAAAMERSTTAIRARLARVGCDPDVPGRELSPAAAELLGTPRSTRPEDRR